MLFEWQRKKQRSLRWLRPGVSWRPRGPLSLLLHLCFCPLPGAALYLNSSVLFELVLGVRCPVALPGRSCLSERGCRQPAEAMDQAALQWVPLEQSSGAPCRTAWGAREQHKSACMVRSVVDENRWLCSLPTLGVSGTGFGCTTNVHFADCNALQVFQGRWHPEMSWTVLRLARLTNLQQLELRCRKSSWYG